METLPSPLIFLAAFLIFQAGLLVAGPLATLAHEAGHALAALLLARGPVEVELGQGRARLRLRLGRLGLRVGTVRLGLGFCRYPKTALSCRRVVLIVLAGPAVSLLVAAALLGVLVAPGSGLLAGFGALLGFYANLRVLVGALLPAAGPGGREARTLTVSDAQDVWRILRHPAKYRHHDDCKAA